MDQAVYDLGRDQYRMAVGIDDIDRDKDGFIVLRPTASHVDSKVASLTTDIDTLEEKLKTFRAEREKAVKYQKTEEYKESKKKDKDKKQKKARTTLLDMMFNNADAVTEAEDAEKAEEDEGYRDNKKRAPKKTTLDTTYGKRFSPVVSMLYDSVADFDKIAKEIDEELKSTRGQTRGMYRASMIGNLLTAKDKKLSAVKELGSIAKQVSDLEYRRDKEKKAEEGDTTKLVSAIGAKYLSGSFDAVDSKKGKKGKGKDKGKGNFARSAKKMGVDIDDDDNDDESSVKKGKKNDADSYELAQELAKEVLGRKDEFTFTAHEKALGMEGKYTFVVAVDPADADGTWKFIAVDPKTGKEIKGFKDKYKELFPKRKNVRMRFQLEKKKCTDLNTAKSYKVVFTD